MVVLLFSMSEETQVSSPHDERHISIHGTDEQISDALVVLGKRLTRKCIRSPMTKKTGPASSMAQSPTPPP